MLKTQRSLQKPGGEEGPVTDLPQPGVCSQAGAGLQAPVRAQPAPEPHLWRLPLEQAAQLKAPPQRGGTATAYGLLCQAGRSQPRAHGEVWGTRLVRCPMWSTTHLATHSGPDARPVNHASQPPSEMGPFLLQMRKLEPREVKSLAQGHNSSEKGWTWTQESKEAGNTLGHEGSRWTGCTGPG